MLASWTADSRHLFFFYAIFSLRVRKEVENRMKKALSKETLEKEAALWNAVKELAKQNPGNVCRK